MLLSVCNYVPGDNDEGKFIEPMYCLCVEMEDQ